MTRGENFSLVLLSPNLLEKQYAEEVLIKVQFNN